MNFTASLGGDVGLEGHGSLVFASFRGFSCLLIKMVLDAECLLALGPDQSQ